MQESPNVGASEQEHVIIIIIIVAFIAAALLQLLPTSHDLDTVRNGQMDRHHWAVVEFDVAVRVGELLPLGDGTSVKQSKSSGQRALERSPPRSIRLLSSSYIGQHHCKDWARHNRIALHVDVNASSPAQCHCCC